MQRATLREVPETQGLERTGLGGGGGRLRHKRWGLEAMKAQREAEAQRDGGGRCVGRGRLRAQGLEMGLGE